MRPLRSIALAFLALCLSLPASAQWKGGVSVEGGWNFGENWLEKTAFNIAYDGTGRFYSSFDFSQSKKKEKKDIVDVIVDNRTGKLISAATLTFQRPDTREIGSNLVFGFRPGKQDDVNLTLRYGSKRVISTSEATFVKDYEDVDTEDPVLSYGLAEGHIEYGVQKNSTDHSDRARTATLNYVHKFLKHGSSARAYMSLSYNPNEKEERRTLTGSYFSKKVDYRIAPFTDTGIFTAGLHYDDPMLFGVERLKGSAGIDFKGVTALDHYGGEVLDPQTEQWRDSTRLTADYLYEAVSIVPFVTAMYSLQKFDFRLDLRIGHCGEIVKLVSDDDSGSSIVEDFDLGMTLGSVWRIAEGHSLSFYYLRSMKRPEYKKLTRVLTVGSSESQYYIGNPELRPYPTNSLTLAYSLSCNALEIKPSISYEYMPGKFEQVLYVLTPEQRKKLGSTVENISVYTWINSARQWAHHYVLEARWKGKRFSADFAGKVNRNIFEYRDSDPSRALDWKVEGGVAFKLPLQFTISARATYKSELRTAYARYDDYVNASARLTKSFAHGITVFAEGRDLFDDIMEIEILTPSRDYSSTTKTNYYRRALAAGVKWNF